ncbi:M48 family metalloprotease [Hansschlegelia zhihuaiae]|uniref:M48 family peptidase n=1 Tax=Hansschlegelia zhihuaiae TaxID=405005 RepID=A0A4Q0MK57_9HYPH|nr:M48 family metalloprotease [Hansschlegelia zhihuaiae]RXF73980.1 M48 family peptidase [Hansschlegelia zhihuaiae]
MSFIATTRSILRGGVRRATALLAAAAIAVAGATPPAGAQSTRGLPVIRDAEIEGLLRDYMTPIFRAAGINEGVVEITLINSREFNAFVADGRRIFVNIGTLMDAKTPNEVIGVLAHETGHIVGGHLARLRLRLEQAQTMSIVAMLLGIGGAAAAISSGGQHDGGAVMGAAMAPQEAIRRSLLSYQRGEEEAADRAAVGYLSKSGQSAKGMLTTFKRFEDQIAFSKRFIDPYAQSHPMPADRIANLEAIAKKSPFFDKLDPPALQARHDLMRAKLFGFVDTAQGVGRRYPPGDNSLPARYARAIASYRSSSLDGAIAQIDGLIREQPNNPWFNELKGQAYLENGKPQQAIPPLKRALALAPNAQLVRTMLGQALNAGGGKTGGDAVAELTRATARDPKNADGFRELAIALAKKGRIPEADLATAQAAFASGDYGTARQIANRAKAGLKPGTPNWLKADDIATYTPPKRD